jgi:hypothetical protein
MTDQNNPTQQNSNSPLDQKVDTTINQGIDNLAGRVPEGQKLDPMAKQRADQAANNELSKGVGGVEQDAKNILDRRG